MIWRCDLEPQAENYLKRIQELTAEVLRSGRYCLASKLAAFEREFADYHDVRHCVGVANGTDALILALRALETQAGDEIITTPFTAIPTLSAIVAAGARPAFVDIDPDTFLLDIDQVARAVTDRTRAVMPVHLFAQMVDVDALRSKLPRSLPVIEDAAQAHGCRWRGKMAGTVGEMAAFSFYPTKNLGAYGDGGAVLTDRDELAEKLRLLRNYGKETADRIILDGVNSRLDELQAAYLSLKLPDLEAMNEKRRDLADCYAEHLAGLPVVPPTIRPEAVPNYHVYVVRVLEDRDGLKAHLREQDVQTDIFYPHPHHLQPVFRGLGYERGRFPHAEKAGEQVLALPMYPELTQATVVRVCDCIRAFYGGKSHG
jgi:dTDP-4-amino-4,6-dideoxygalactose transaminase